MNGFFGCEFVAVLGVVIGAVLCVLFVIAVFQKRSFRAIRLSVFSFTLGLVFFIVIARVASQHICG